MTLADLSRLFAACVFCGGMIGLLVAAGLASYWEDDGE